MAEQGGDAVLGFVGKEVVLDTEGPLLYIGRLEAADPHYLTLAEVDVHDINEGRTTKERYILEARKLGVRKNRALALVRREAVVSVSRLEDVVEY